VSRNDRGCAVHNGANHGGEAEELRSGIEALIKHDLHVTSSDLQSLLDRVDARDSLAYLEPRNPEAQNTLPKDLVSHESSTTAAHHGLDTDETVCFYEQEFYPLSNFSAFTLEWKGYRFDTSEAAYHWEKFTGPDNGLARFAICTAPSAHAAFQIARSFKESKRTDWDDVKINVMRTILRAKVAQHPYVRKKLLETGVRRLVENSWRDDFWGWGERRDGKNTLGVLWMEIRSEVQAETAEPLPSPPASSCRATL
jgi:ribA/ribD-fused uncharacterized protein